MNKNDVSAEQIVEVIDEMFKARGEAPVTDVRTTIDRKFNLTDAVENSKVRMAGVDSGKYIIKIKNDRAYFYPKV